MERPIFPFFLHRRADSVVNMQAAEIIERLIGALLMAIALSWSWLIWRLLTGQPVLPARTQVGRRNVPWHLGTILLVFLLYVAVSLVISASYPLVSRLVAAKPKQAAWFDLMLLNGLVMAVLLVLVPWVVRTTSGARAGDFGLSFDDWWHQAVHGVIATLIAAPPVYAIQFGAAKIWTPLQHPLSKMIDEEFSVGVGWLAVVTAVILAPMLEELVFRGLVQSWLVSVLKQGSRSLGLPLRDDSLCRDSTDQELPVDVWEAKPEFVSLSPAPMTELPGQIESHDRGWLGVVLTSLLFAYVHAPQWPAPIALFVLALVIGSVFNRTGSLITAICMHATFNGITTIMLFMMALSGQKLVPDKAAGPAPVALRATVEINKPSAAAAIAGDCTL
jgi:membrane protease YdiL (CAAX protease family)